MGDHSSENYLDQLLNSMHGEETEHPKEQQAAKQVLRDDFEKQLFGEEETKEKAKAKNEEDFLREFEEELGTFRRKQRRSNWGEKKFPY